MLTLTKLEASNFLKRIRSGEPVGEIQNLRDDGVQSGITLKEIGLTKLRLDSIRKEELTGPQSAMGRYEAEAATILHRNWRLTPAAVGNPGFWIWLSVVHFRDLIEWRHGAPDKPANVDNYGLGNRWDGFLLRMWMRGEIGHRSGDDPYRITRLGDQDVWRSHIFRQDFGSCRLFAQGFIAEIYDPVDPNRPKLATEQIRELAKRVRRVYATTPLELLDFESSRALVRAEIGKILAEG